MKGLPKEKRLWGRVMAGLLKEIARCRRAMWLIVPVLLLPLCAAHAGEKVTLQLRWDHQFQFAGYYAADWMGYYRDAGFEVTIRPAVNPDMTILSSITEVVEGRADFGVGAADILQAVDKGADLTVLASIFQQSAAGFYYKEDLTIRSLADLTRLKVARRVNDLIDIELQAMLKSEGIELSSITSADHEPGIEHLVDGRVDILPAYAISIPYVAKGRGVTLKVLRPSTYGVDFYGDSLFTSGEAAGRDPERVQRFLEASLKGWRYALDHSDAIVVRIAREKSRHDPVDDVLRFNRFQVEGVRKLTLDPVVELGWINPNRWRRMHDFLKISGIVSNSLDIRKLIFDPVRRNRDRAETIQRTLIVSFVFLLTVVVGFFLWIRALRGTVKARTRNLTAVNLDLKNEMARREKLVEDLAESEERLKFVLEGSRLGFWDWDMEKEVVRRNERWARMLGYTHEEIKATVKQWQDFIHPEDRKAAWRSIEDHLEGRTKMHKIEYRMIMKDGDFKWILDQAMVVKRDSEGRPLRMSGTHTDISGRKKAEEDLRREAKLNYLLSRLSGRLLASPYDVEKVARHTLGSAMDITGSAHGYVAAIDPDNPGNEGFSFTETMAGECGRKDAEIHFPLDGSGNYSALWGHSLITEEPFYTNTPAEHPSSRGVPEGHIPIDGFLSVPVMIGTSLVGQVALANPGRAYTDDDLSAIERLAGIYALALDRHRDHQDKEALRRQLHQMQKLEAIGSLAGGIAHDFNNLLSPIIGFSEMILEDMPADDSHRENLTEVITAGKRASGLVKQILAFSRQAKQEVRPVRLPGIINEVLQLCRSTLPVTIEIKKEIPEIRGHVMADPTRIHQVAMNLVTNAFHAMQESGGTLWVRLGERSLEPSEAERKSMIPGTYVRLTVEDTGVGMSPATLEKAFDPYFTTKDKEKGTGLGLALAHGIVESYKGKVMIRSEQGRGTRVEVWLPRVAPPALEQEDSPKNTGEKSPGGRILLVDDDESVLRMMTRMLTRVGHEVTPFSDPGEALSLFREAPDNHDLVITDMTMPGLTGDDLCRVLKEIRPDIPVVVCTGYSEKLGGDKAAAIGMDAVLMKPIVRDELEETVKTILEGFT